MYLDLYLSDVVNYITSTFKHKKEPFIRSGRLKHAIQIRNKWPTNENIINSKASSSGTRPQDKKNQWDRIYKSNHFLQKRTCPSFFVRRRKKFLSQSQPSGRDADVSGGPSDPFICSYTEYRWSASCSTGRHPETGSEAGNDKLQAVKLKSKFRSVFDYVHRPDYTIDTKKDIPYKSSI